jgi:methyl-accepting chemotaxis protein
VELQPDHLATMMEQIAETVIAATDTVEQLSERMDDLAQQVQQQGYQVFALTDAVQTLTDNQDTVIKHIAHLTETLDRIAASLETR